MNTIEDQITLHKNNHCVCLQNWRIMSNLLPITTSHNNPVIPTKLQHLAKTILVVVSVYTSDYMRPAASSDNPNCKRIQTVIRWTSDIENSKCTLSLQWSRRAELQKCVRIGTRIFKIAVLQRQPNPNHLQIQ